MPNAASLSETLAAFVAATGYEDLPEEIIASTKQRLLDTLGCAWAGATAPGCQAAENTILAEGATGLATLWASGKKASARGAAFVNSTHAAALDYDSVYERGSVHPDIVTVPAAWALAEANGASGRELLAAIALGNEVACRLGAANTETKGWFYTSVNGVFGAAAASAKLLGLDNDGIADALGLAFARAGGTQQALVEKSLAKRTHSGLAAESAVFVAQLAAAGIDGPRQAIEGKHGFHALYGAGDSEVLLADLGRQWEQASVAIKKYPSCTANHVAIDLLIEIAETEDLIASDIEAVEIKLSPFAMGLVGADFDPSENPQVAAQFSIHYSAASALLRRRLGITEIQNAAVFDSTLAAFLPKISVSVDEANVGKFAPASVCLTTIKGEKIKRRLQHVPGTPENPLSEAEIQAKFRDCAASGPKPLGTDQADALMAGLDTLDSAGDIRDVFASVHS